MREGWDRYFMRIAEQVASRATCDRKQVGCLLVIDRSIVATGYNGSLRGEPHCDDAGHLMVEGHCVRTVHAESNAVAQAARRGVRLDGATCYVTASPCFICLKLLAQAGIIRIVAGEFYRDELSLEMAKRIGIDVVVLEQPAACADTQPCAGFASSEEGGFDSP